MPPEKSFENRVKRWLTGLGIYALGTPENKMLVPSIGYFEKRWGGGYSQSGLPDLHIVINGINIDCELKARTGRPSELQKFMVHQINQCGSVALILYPDGFQEFQNLILGVIDRCNSHIPALNALKVALSNSNYVIKTS